MNFYHLKERGLTLDKLLAFVAVARAGSVAEAAKGVESRRSLMSRQVGELESALGVELFLRKGKSLEITTAGRELALLSAAYFEEIEGLSARFSGNKGLLKLGAGAAVLEAMVFPAIRTLRRSLPDCRFEFIPDSTRGVGQRLHDGSLDIGIVRASYEDGGLIRKSCGTMKFVLVGRRDFDSKLPSWTITQFLSRVPMALIRGEGSLVDCSQSCLPETYPKKTFMFWMTMLWMLWTDHWRSSLRSERQGCATVWRWSPKPLRRRLQLDEAIARLP